MKILDRYILKNFIQNFIFGILSFLIIFILVDLFENLDKFVDANLEFYQIIEFYTYFIPEIIKLITPVGMLLASLFTISRFINYSELTGMQSAGMSIYRYLSPILVFAFIITGSSIYFNGWIVPEANKKKFQFERLYFGKHHLPQTYTNLYFQEDRNKIISIPIYNDAINSANNITINIFNPNELNQLLERFDIYQMSWDSSLVSWTLHNVNQRQFKENSDSILNYNYYQTINIKEIPQISELSITPDLIRKKQLKPDEMSLGEHQEFIINLRTSGLETARTEVDYYSRISFPFASIVTVLFGVSLSNNRRKGGAALQFGIAILVSFIYLGFVKISQVFGYNGDINPVLTAWLANIIFLLISGYNFYRIQKN